MSGNDESVLDVLDMAKSALAGEIYSEAMKDKIADAQRRVAELIAAAEAYRNEASCPDMVQFSQDRKIYDDAERRLVAALAACKG